MSSIRRNLSRALIKLLSKLPIKFLLLIEDKVQSGMGKGFGAATTSEEVKVIAHFVKIRNIKKVLALDVGANIGNWSASIIEAIPTALVFAFEPSRQAFIDLDERFNTFENVQCMNFALGQSDEKSVLYADKSASGLASLSKRRVGHFGIEFNFQEEINITKLDTWIKSKSKDFSPNILKMDVEGHELDVLKGAGESLNSIEIVQFEFGGSNIDSRTFFQDFWYFFMELGFDIYRISPSGFFLITKYLEADETFRPTNYVAVRR